MLGPAEKIERLFDMSGLASEKWRVPCEQRGTR
jgi:hypothetical protein